MGTWVGWKVQKSKNFKVSTQELIVRDGVLGSETWKGCERATASDWLVDWDW